MKAAKVRRSTGAEPSLTAMDWRRMAVGALAVTALVALAQSILFSAPPLLLLAPLAALVAALACEGPAEAALTAFIGAVAGVVLAAAVSRAPWDAPSQWLPDGLGVAVVAAVVAFAVTWVRPRLAWAERAMQAAAIGLLLAALWVAGTAAANTPATDGSTAVGVIASPPPLSATSSDEDVYAHYLRRIRGGEGYYRAAAETLRDANAVRPRPVDAASPLSYRLPTLYVALAALPPRAPAYAALAWASLAAVAGFALARRFAGPSLALVAAAVTGTYCASIATSVAMLDAEWWAGVLGLVAVALLAWADRAPRPLAIAVAASVAGLAAALVREIALPFVLVGLAAGIAGVETRRGRAWLPWAVALALAIGAYALHWGAAADAARALRLPAIGTQGSWFHPDGRGLAAAADRLGLLLAMKTPLAWAALAAAVGGAVLAAARQPSARVALGAVAVAGPLLLAVVYPSGATLAGTANSYWADVVMPTTLACLPLLLAPLVPAQTQDGRPEGRPPKTR